MSGWLRWAPYRLATIWTFPYALNVSYSVLQLDSVELVGLEGIVNLLGSYTV